MKKKGKKITLGSVVSLLFGLACAAVLGFVFYATMVYQLTGEQSAPAETLASPAPLVPGAQAQALFPGELLALDGFQLMGEQARDEIYGGEVCRVITRTYLREDGLQVNAISACPDAYVQRFAQEAFVPQLVTGFSIAQLDAVYALGKTRSALYARQGTCIYVIEAQTDEQTLYALGAQARIGL